MSASRSSCEPDRLNSVVHYASQNPIKFVAIASLLVTGTVPVGAFLLYAAGTVVCTLIAAIVLDLTLLAFGVFGLLLALCFVGCISGGVAGLFSVVYFGYRAAVGSLNHARARLAPTTVSASSSGEPPSSDGEEKNKHYQGAMPDLLTSLTTFVTCFSRLMPGQLIAHYYYNGNTTGGSDDVTSGTSGELANTCSTDDDDDDGNSVERYSDLWRTSLTVLALTAAVFVMLYTVLVVAYVVIHFT